MPTYFELSPNWRSIVMEEIRPEIKRKSEAGLEAARQAAPVVTGEYRDSLRLDETSGGYDLVADTDYAAKVEYGAVVKNGKRPLGHRVLQKAADVIKRS